MTNEIDLGPAQPCPCCSGAAYMDCCGPLLAGDSAAHTAQSLMRSRFTAYVRRQIPYLLSTWHPSTRPLAIEPHAIPDWHELIIHRTAGGKETDLEGVVEFTARGLAGGRPVVLHEISRFARQGAAWLYLEGEIGGKEIRPGRNEPCPCGSGRKFKRCCGP